MIFRILLTLGYLVLILQAVPLLHEVGSSADCDLSTNSKGLIAVKVPLSYEDPDTKIMMRRTLCIRHSELLSWKSIVQKFFESGNLLGGQRFLPQVHDYITTKLTKMSYSEEMIKGDGGTELPLELQERSYSAEYISRSIIEAIFKADTSSGRRLNAAIETNTAIPGYQERQKQEKDGASESTVPPFVKPLNATMNAVPAIFANNIHLAKVITARSNPVSIMRNLLDRQIYGDNVGNNEASTNIPVNDECPIEKQRARSLYIVYQTRNVNTGGTAALDSLYTHLRTIWRRENSLLLVIGLDFDL